MSLTTSNIYGKIIISDDVVAAVASQAASECYGVVEMVSRGFGDNIRNLWGNASSGKGVKVTAVDNLMFIELYVVLKIGVNIETVKKSVADTVKFALESFTGMRVKKVQVNVVGIRV
ncbi:MAG: Asp23/Gls24 family envelope stress response protein [Clostridia bacterium]|nr:Asp23/Gls24 family envelope stress response protein [Clostridia bacterium]